MICGTKIESNVIASQIALHQKWGGVVPEAAARAHVESINTVVEEALRQANRTLNQIDGFAATNRPGLIGALSVGVSAAKALAYFSSKKWIGIHHLEGHIWSILSAEPELEPPFISLVVSGGHTELVYVRGLGEYEILGETVDDAAGEAFDKAARTIGLPYPGGRALSELATESSGNRYSLPVAKVKGMNFSFSGLKTAVWQTVEREGKLLDRATFAHCIQEAIIKPLVIQSERAMEERSCKIFTVCGGVSANVRLREALKQSCTRRGIHFLAPETSLCTDNAAMIGLTASMRFERGESSTWHEDVSSNAPISSKLV